jgi:hypothetical protein
MRMLRLMTPHTSKLCPSDSGIVGKSGIFRLQHDRAVLNPVAFDGKSAIQQRKHDAAVDRIAGPVDDRNIAGKNARAGHALALDANGEGRRRMLDEQLVKIERTVDIVLGRRRKSPSGRPGHHRYALCGPALDIEKRSDVAPIVRGREVARDVGQPYWQPHYLGPQSRSSPRPCPSPAVILFCAHIRCP